MHICFCYNRWIPSVAVGSLSRALWIHFSHGGLAILSALISCSTSTYLSLSHNDLNTISFPLVDLDAFACTVHSWTQMQKQKQMLLWIVEP